MDVHSVIKVSDFGLSEDMYAKNYFRQDKDASVKLPVKWMAPESLNDGIFTEKTDVVCLFSNVVLLLYSKQPARWPLELYNRP